MSSLAKIQRDFCQSFLRQSHKDFLHHVKAATWPAEAALNIYHTTIYTIHTHSLARKFPLVFSVMGAVKARLLAQSYICSDLPHQGCLEDWGSGFPAYIQNHGSLSLWPYLSDIAHYEWACHIAQGAAGGQTLTFEEINRLVSHPDMEILFKFQDFCQLMVFSWPVDSILAAIQREPSHPLPETYPEKSCYALIFKQGDAVKTQWLSPALFAFLNRLKEGQDTDVALAAASILEPGFDMRTAFDFLLTHPILQK